MYKSVVTICRSDTVEAKSISMLIAIELPKGTELRIYGDGPDQKDCIEEIRSWIENHFYDE